MGKMLNAFAEIAVNYGIIYRAFYRNGHRTSLVLKKTGSVVMHHMMYIFNHMYLLLTERLLESTKSKRDNLGYFYTDR